jgi:hypothetical protein
VGRIYQAWLPFDACYQYARPGLWPALARKAYNTLLWGSDRGRIGRIIAGGGYDFVHLNSLVLHPLVSGSHRFILHMRDVYDGGNLEAVRNVRRAAGVVFIDEATRAPFRDVPLLRSIVLNNPFDMTGVAAYRDYRPPLPDLDPSRHTVFSVIGVASEAKGTGFIVRAFLKHRDVRSRLIIVGGRERAELDDCRRVASEDRRVIFWGEEREIDKVYAVTDYVLRGEAFPCIGRTVYEGLYAGCRVIAPGDPDAPPPLFEAHTFRDAVHFYRPRDEQALLALFDRLAGDKVGGRTLRSNIAAYERDFTAFVTAVAATGA